MNILRLLATAMFLAGFLQVVEAKTCTTPKQAMAYWDRRDPSAKVVLIQGPLASRFVEELNKRPPVTDYVGDAIVVIHFPHSPQVVVIGIFRDGCLKQKGPLPRRFFENVMRHSKDTEA